MTKSRILSAAVLAVALISLSACGNTIRGLGKDTANAVSATRDAGSSVVNAVK